MEVETGQSRNLQLLTELERRVSNLLGDYDKLVRENQLLKQQQEKLSSEKAGLNEKHRQAHLKIESMLTQLKSLEQLEQRQ